MFVYVFAIYFRHKNPLLLMFIISQTLLYSTPPNTMIKMPIYVKLFCYATYRPVVYVPNSAYV